MKRNTGMERICGWNFFAETSCHVQCIWWNLFLPKSKIFVLLKVQEKEFTSKNGEIFSWCKLLIQLYGI